MGRDRTDNVRRGVADVNLLVEFGVNCSISTNNVLNPFTPFGDVSLIRAANLYANIAHVGARHDFCECFEMISARAARLLRLPDYGVREGAWADLVVLDAPGRAATIAELAPPLMGFKRGRQTFEHKPATLLRP
jgi:cytosine deaminase